jgi:hypothetical protein
VDHLRPKAGAIQAVGARDIPPDGMKDFGERRVEAGRGRGFYFGLGLRAGWRRVTAGGGGGNGWGSLALAR